MTKTKIAKKKVENYLDNLMLKTIHEIEDYEEKYNRETDKYYKDLYMNNIKILKECRVCLWYLKNLVRKDQKKIIKSEV